VSAISDRADIRQRREALRRRASYASTGVAVTLIVVKLFAWGMTGSVSLLSSLLDSLLDAAASLLSLFAIRHATTPADREHRFGHGKAEPLAALGQAAFIAGSAVFLLMQAVERLFSPSPVTHSGVGIAVMVLSIAATIALVRYQRHVVEQTDSVAIAADSLHYRGDLVLNGSVIVSLLLSDALRWPYADPLFGGGIACWIIYNAWQIAATALVQLMDRELPDTDRAHIRAIAQAHPEVKSVHDLRTRAAGPTSFIQLHVEMDGGMSLSRAHLVSDEVEAKILEAFPSAEIIIHQDPEGVEEPRVRFPPAKAAPG
jgi:ferrous-iron efflux pump FieF